MSYRELLAGCGRRREKILKTDKHPAWENLTSLDIEPEVEPDVVWDLNERPLPFDDNTFDEIHFYEVLEHIGRQGDYKTFFKEFSEYSRILKPDGMLCATTPLWDGVWAWGDPGHVRVISEGSLVFLSQKMYAEQQGKTAMTDYRSIYKADFEKVWERRTDSYVFVLRCIKPPLDIERAASISVD